MFRFINYEINILQNTNIDEHKKIYIAWIEWLKEFLRKNASNK